MAERIETKTKQQRDVVAIAIDGSENAKYAYQFYAKNVWKEGDKVYLLHSMDINDALHSTGWYSSPYMFDHEVMIKLLEDEKERLRHRLEQFAMLFQESGIDGTVKSIHAESPGHGICKAAEEIGASLVVVGSRGMGKMRRTLMGSISDYVLHHSHVPVLICKHTSDHHHHHHGQHDKNK